jgi:DNA ligase-1
MNNLPTLYARTQTGAIQTWTVTVHENKYQTTFGQVDGKLQTTNWTECYGTNTGRSNERTPWEQAKFEAEALWKKKKDSGYFESIKDVDVVKFVEPMLAKNFEDYSDKLKFPVYCQPKLDGIRCITTKDGMFSRNGKEIVSCPHIQEELEYFFVKFPDAVLDGELYCDKLNNDFNKICSLVKKTKPTKEDTEESSNVIQYWIYDTVRPERFYSRFGWVMSSVNETEVIRIVPTITCNDIYKLDLMYGAYVNDGYEGQMVRIDAPYENKRSKTLLKRKEFQDDEYTILDVIEGEGNKAGMAGAMVFENELGISFNSNIKGNRDYLKEIWANKHNYKGKRATVKYFNLTPDNKLPRFPYVIGIRDYE